MKGVLLKITGNWAHFKRPETNNNPLSHDFITKTALLGMMGAVTGKNREEMRKWFPVLSEDLKYGVQINNEVKKQSWGFTFRFVNDAWKKSPKQMEFIRNPDYHILIGLGNKRSEEIFSDFVSFCKEGKAYYQPVLGLHNCPAEISWLDEGKIEYRPKGIFTTQSFVSVQHTLDNSTNIETGFRIGFDKIPGYQNEDGWNLPEKYVSVVYPSMGNELQVQGEHYIFKGDSQWFMI